MSVFFVNSDNDGDDSHSTPTNSGGTQAVSEAHQNLQSFWPRVTEEIKKLGQVRLDLKTQALPLARIKKIMKLDQEVKMISAEAPMLFSKAAELFIHELTLRAWIHTEDNKRRTLQRNDIAMAITKFDQFDFLIDIVPRDEVKPASNRPNSEARTSMNPDQVHYYFNLAQQHQAALQQSSATTNVATPTNSTQTIQVVQQNPTQLQTITVANPQEQTNSNNLTAASTTAQTQPQVVQLQTTNANQAQATATGGLQLFQQVVTPSGEVQQLPIQLTPSQLQMIRMQIQGNATQPIILQAQPQPQIIQVVNQPFLTQGAATNPTSETE
uniref:Nuclear transcription factor Y subunit gamma n=1 Tax=Clastoptera arizonana TaxID=38151 RepID=A0A1B6E070_9HEMI